MSQAVEPRATSEGADEGNWYTFLNPHRLTETEPVGRVDAVRALVEDQSPHRSEYQRDVDRILYASSFRRLQGKTQVHPLPELDYIRTRLTHSLEAATIGRSLGFSAGSLLGNSTDQHYLMGQHVANIVYAACLIHDIGNPPFGHTGEFAIQHWFETRKPELLKELTDAQCQDFLNFEGNAQGFRIVTRLQHFRQRGQVGGMELTYATLGAFLKYPQTTEALCGVSAEGSPYKKYSVFQTEVEILNQVTTALAMPCWSSDPPVYARHPFAFLVEAADDIAYNIVDLEDSCRLGFISSAEGIQWLEAIYQPGLATSSSTAVHQDGIGKYRARAIHRLVELTESFFQENRRALFAGEPVGDWMSALPDDVREAFRHIKQATRQRYYNASRVLELEDHGFQMIHFFMDEFYGTLSRCAGKPVSFKSLPPRDKLNLKLMQVNSGDELSAQEWLHRMTDTVSAMTDDYADRLYKRFHQGSWASLIDNFQD